MVGGCVVDVVVALWGASVVNAVACEVEVLVLVASVAVFVHAVAMIANTTTSVLVLAMTGRIRVRVPRSVGRNRCRVTDSLLLGEIDGGVVVDVRQRRSGVAGMM